MVYVPKTPRWVEPMPYLIYVSPKDFTGHTHLVFHQVKLSTLIPLSKREVNVRLCFGEVGVDLELCVHAHGPEVELLMEASRSNNNPLVITSSLIYAWSFATVVSTILFFFPISWTSLSACLLQMISLVQPISRSTLEYTLWYRENIMELPNFLWVLHLLLFLTDSNFPGFWVVVNREH